MDTHTQTPWQCHSGSVYTLENVLLATMNRTHRAEPYDEKDTRNNPTIPTERDANAAFIVRACNAHDALVEALERLAKTADKCIPSDDCSNHTLADADEAIMQALRALKLAKGNA